MDSQLGAPVWESLPDRVRDELTDVDRLRAIWAQHRRCRTPEDRSAARRALTHERVRAWGDDPALAELLLFDADETEPPLTGDRIVELCAPAVRSSAAEGALGTPPSPEEAGALAEAAIVPAHPVVRAAHVYAACARGTADEHVLPDTDGSLPLLPWILASHVLQRADHPPLFLDPRSPPPRLRSRQDEAEHFAELVVHFARSVRGALRAEIGWSPGSVPVPDGPVSPLAAVTRRRVLDYVRSRSAPVALILRALDPEARATVTSGDGRVTEGTAPRAPLTPGAAYWWARLELEVGEASLSLHVVVQDVGSPPSGVLAVTADARLITPDGVQEALRMSDGDSVTVMPSDCVDDRWPQVRDLVDEAVSRSMNELTRV
ncbi:hypothetical protein [Nocardiopsis sp. MG754419]|uniref:hypothetical protein n=1 Tax=Nocardiopsis sp. MG754419 TaxID=2259865 RepID=UPI001BA8D624|nr:hypothetical protein [Nocardiopsis sp. MG754419]MBR8741324.1 hypothetical protein [Nocardiopsis sp. MG754419]